jgi:hypothetical protein
MTGDDMFIKEKCMNYSINHSGFNEMVLETNDDYEPYGYAQPQRLQTHSYASSFADAAYQPDYSLYEDYD